MVLGAPGAGIVKMSKDAVTEDLAGTALPARPSPSVVAEPSSGQRRRKPAAAALATAIGLIVGGVVVARQPVSAAVPKVALETPATAMNQSVGVGNNSPTLMADPGESRFVVLANRVDSPDFSCALQVSGDGGRNWAPVNPVPQLPEGAEKCYGPEVAFDHSGVLYFLFVGLAGAGNEPMGIFLTSSSDRGVTFNPPRQVLGPLRFAVRMAIDGTIGRAGRLHLVWIEATSDPGLGAFGPPPNPIMHAYSDDGGERFSKPVQISDPKRQRVVAPALVLGVDHAVHVAYYDLNRDAVDYQGLDGPTWGEPWSLVVTSSRDGGRHFSIGTMAEPSVTPPDRVLLIFTMEPPSLVTYGRRRMCLAWTDGRHGDPDVFVRCSSNGGQRWAGPRRLNDDPVGNGVSQHMPRLAVAPGGRVDAIFYDRRKVPGNFVNDIYFSSSTNGGDGWAPNRRITRDGSDSRIGAQYANVSAQGRYEFGSRIGLLATPRSAVAAWADTRNSRPQTAGQDVFTTVISPLPAGPSSRRSELFGGAAMVSVGIALALSVLVGLRRRRDADA